ncbi:MAG: recombinase zinc beta ribbon domain-containing protein [Myxococcota bacterium]
MKEEGLVRGLVKAGLVRPTYERSFNKARVEAQLKNPFYAGKFIYKGRLYQGNHEPMLTAEEWERLQDTFGKRGAYQKRKHDGALSGFLRCAECGCAMVYDPKTKPNGKVYKYYVCSNMRRWHEKKPRIAEDKLFELFAPMVDDIQISSRTRKTSPKR